MNTALDETNTGLFETLSAVIDAYDVYTCGHSRQVAMYAQMLAERLNLSSEDRQTVVRAALIHDIGKIGVADSIIAKQAPLTNEEYACVKRHPEIGAEIVGRTKGMQRLVPLIRHHHERWDGRGYPDGLAGTDLPLGARILALADSVDAMFSDRPYHPRCSVDEVLSELRRCAGQQFDPQVVRAFVEIANDRGAAFFSNSATTVETDIAPRGPSCETDARYFLKRSMVA